MADNLNGATTAIFVVALSVAVTEPIDVEWSTKDGTGKAGIDYEAANGVLTFQPGETEKQIQVLVYGRDETAGSSDKTFYIAISPTNNAIVGTALVDCTITVTDAEGTPVTSVIVAQGRRGLRGDPGRSAYEQAVLMGYTGTVQQWMDEIGNAADAAERAENAAATAASQANAQILPNVNAAQTAATQASQSAATAAEIVANEFDASDYAYATLALAQAATSTLPANTEVKVLKDPDATKNGSYLWNGTTLSKSDYDPLVQGKQYTDSAITEIGIENTPNNPNTGDAKLSFAVVDKNGLRTWIEADGEGLPTQYAIESIGDGVGLKQEEYYEVAFALIDKNGKRTWLEAGKDGLPTPYTLAVLQDMLNLQLSSTALFFKNSYQDKQTKITSGPNIVCWGDSMTAGAGAVHPYSYYLQQLLTQSGSTAVVRNCGVGGESSETICARQGGNPFLITVNSGTIDASASTLNPITFLSQGGTTVSPTPLLQGSGNPFENIGYFKGNLYGISGQIHPLNGGYVFVRDESGTSITANRPTHFYTNYSKELRDSIAIIWVGQNSNPSAGLDDARAIQDAKAMARHLETLDKRYLVINKPISVPDEDKLWYAEFGDRYIAARKYLMEYGLADAGLTPTQQDLDSIAAGYIPNSLRYDNVHWNDYGYEILANLIFKRLKDLEWI